MGTSFDLKLYIMNWTYKFSFIQHSMEQHFFISFNIGNTPELTRACQKVALILIFSMCDVPSRDYVWNKGVYDTVLGLQVET